MEKHSKKQKKEQKTGSQGGPYALGIKVVNGNIEGALKKFKTMIKDSGIMDEYKERQEFFKPSEKLRLQKQRAIRRREKNDMENYEK